MNTKAGRALAESLGAMNYVHECSCLVKAAHAYMTKLAAYHNGEPRALRERDQDLWRQRNARERERLERLIAYHCKGIGKWAITGYTLPGDPRGRVTIQRADKRTNDMAGEGWCL